MSSGGTQAFQLLTEEMGPAKSTLSIAQGTPGLPGPLELVQSQRRQRFLMTMTNLKGEQGGRRLNEKEENQGVDLLEDG